MAPRSRRKEKHAALRNPAQLPLGVFLCYCRHFDAPESIELSFADWHWQNTASNQMHSLAVPHLSPRQSPVLHSQTGTRKAHLEATIRFHRVVRHLASMRYTGVAEPGP